MSTYARIVNAKVVEVFVEPTGVAIAQCFHADVVAQFVVCPAGTVAGTTFDGTHWTPPAAPPAAAPAALPMLTAMQLYLAFTPAERIAIKASNDAMVKEFWATYSLAAQLNHPIDPNLVSVQEGLAYLATPTTATPPGPGILASQTRVAQILAGTPQ